MEFSDRNFSEHMDSDMIASSENNSGNHQQNAAANNIITSLLLTFGRLISDDCKRSERGQRLRTEHKLKAAIRRKKLALGMKEKPLENLQYGK